MNSDTIEISETAVFYCFIRTGKCNSQVSFSFVLDLPTSLLLSFYVIKLLFLSQLQSK